MKNQEVRGDDKPMTDKGSSYAGDYSKSLGEASQSDLRKGYCGKAKISEAGSDQPNFA